MAIRSIDDKMPARGVRNSCEVVATNRDFIWPNSRSRVKALSNSSSARLRSVMSTKVHKLVMPPSLAGMREPCTCTQMGLPSARRSSNSPA